MKNQAKKTARTRNAGTRIAAALFVLLFALGGGAMLTGCEEKGPAEKAGEKLDNAVEEIGDGIDEAAEDAGDAVEEAADEVEEATDGN